VKFSVYNSQIKQRILFFFVLIFSVSCYKSPFPGYENFGNGTYYRLISFETESREATENTFIEVQYAKSYCYKDTLSKIENFWINLNDFKESSPLKKIISQSVAGDSISIILPSNLFLFSLGKDTSMLKVNMKIKNRFNKEQHTVYLKRWLDEMEMKEQTYIKDYIIDHQYQNTFLYFNGIYQRIIEKGNLMIPKTGDELTIHYVGTLLDGREFDNSYANGEPLKFVYGNSGQIIKGIELALKNIGEGGESEIIIPSQLAFGEKGTVNGAVAPYTSVKYIVKLISIDRKNA
jgi:FKBP-type peptidyl-prolyl cis-trans isomerase